MSSVTVKYERKDLLGRGTDGTVFRGTFAGKEVAVKRMAKNMGEDVDNDVQCHEETAMKQLNHDNVLKLIEVQEDPDFKYFILELCSGTLLDYITGKYIDTMPSNIDKMPSNIDGMIQMASGLKYIHGQHFVHRDIKPANILISISHVMKISDFGHCRPVTGSGTFSMSSGPRGTRMYNSPEYIRIDEKTEEERAKIRANVSIDTFSLGCVFFTYITKGGHPFGNGINPFEVPTVNNIYEGKKSMDNVDSALPQDHYAFSMIDGMTEVNANKRWSLEKVLETLTTRR